MWHNREQEGSGKGYRLGLVRLEQTPVPPLAPSQLERIAHWLDEAVGRIDEAGRRFARRLERAHR